MATTINSIALEGTLTDGGSGTLEFLEWSNNAGIDAMPMPASGSEDAFLIDFNGVERRLSITGIWRGTVAQIKGQIERIRALQDGAQNTVVFASDYIEDESNNDSIDVMIDKFNITWNAPGSLASWRLQLVEGSG